MSEENLDLEIPPHKIMFNYNYEKHVIMDYKEGMKFLSALQNAEIATISYNGTLKDFRPILSTDFKAIIMSEQEYKEKKTKLLLGVQNES